MSVEDISFQTADNVTLRGWFYKPSNNDSPFPCLVMAHGFSALKEMDLNTFAAHFTSQLPISCLVYDNRGFGDSDTKQGQPRLEIIPSEQVSDFSDAITYAQSRPDVNKDKIGIWGSSYSGGHVLHVGAVDRRVKAVLSQVPCLNGWDNFHRLIRPDFIGGLNQLFQEGKRSRMDSRSSHPGKYLYAEAYDDVDRLARAAGQPAKTLPVVHEDVHQPSALPTPDSYEFFTAWSAKSNWKNEVTMKS
jgi:cephalosporin-C deacetylase-like acetyl esterase